MQGNLVVRKGLASLKGGSYFKNGSSAAGCCLVECPWCHTSKVGIECRRAMHLPMWSAGRPFSRYGTQYFTTQRVTSEERQVLAWSANKRAGPTVERSFTVKRNRTSHATSIPGSGCTQTAPLASLGGSVLGRVRTIVGLKQINHHHGFVYCHRSSSGTDIAGSSNK